MDAKKQISQPEIRTEKSAFRQRDPQEYLYVLFYHSQRFGFYHRYEHSHRHVERGLPAFYHFIYAHVCFFTLARVKISKCKQNLSL